MKTLYEQLKEDHEEQIKYLKFTINKMQPIIYNMKEELKLHKRLLKKVNKHISDGSS